MALPDDRRVMAVLADVVGLFLTGVRIASANNAADSALNPTAPGGGYQTAANSLLFTAFMGIVIVACLAALALIAIVWTCCGWTRHLMALFSAVFFVMSVILGGIPHGFPVYALFFGLSTLLAAGLVYTDTLQVWFERPNLRVDQPMMAAPEGFELAIPVAFLLRADRPMAVSFTFGCMVGFLGLMFIVWSSDKNTVMAP